ncbi:membrane protein insertion efficiency factor YidD [Mycoplasmatota bacterium]|nr:membrane protein insertion efficiency factor YidD [Mycoplasmatota bacterium]
MSKINKIIIKIIDKYRFHTRYKQKTCRYHPTCSEYAKEAFENKNFFYALVLSIWRILRCNPFSKGGYDPIPGKHKE